MVAADPPKDDRDYIDSIFKAYLEDLGRIGTRHENTRAFYLSVISALFVFLSLAGSEGIFAGAKGSVQLVVGSVGVLICVAWHQHMNAFSKIFAAKREVLRSIEQRLPVKPFTAEKAAIDQLDYRHVTSVDKFTAGTCALLFLVLMFVKFNCIGC